MNKLIQINIKQMSTQFTSLGALSTCTKSKYFNYTVSSLFAIHHHGIHTNVVYLAGHNKWSKIKGPKAIADFKRSKQFGKLCLEIISAVRLTGEDRLEFNPRLASLLSRAKTIGVPKSTIESALSSGMKQNDNSSAQKILYEARGPNGYSLLIETLTDNNKRTKPEIHRILTKNG
jgi:transcriptional/translational regulatory protein YebC/TACO1